MKNYLLYFALLLSACNNAGDGDFARAILKQERHITGVAFSQPGSNVTDTTTITRSATGDWTVNNFRQVNNGRWAAWWAMLADLRVHPLYLDDVTQPSVIARLRDSGLHVVAYINKEKMVTDFYLGHFSNIGTIALVDGRTYLTALPYDEVDVLAYCTADPNFWQDMTVFAYQPSELKSVEIIHVADSSASFRLQYRDTSWTLQDLQGNLQEQVNEPVLRRYVSYFQQVRADSILYSGSNYLEVIADQHHLQYIIHLIAHGKSDCSVRIFGLPLAGGKGYDTDKCLLYIENTQEAALASWVNFDLLLKNLKDFVDKK